MKTTAAGEQTPFLMTPNELDAWQSNLDRFWVVRVFNFYGVRQFYRLRGEPREVANLVEALWDVRPGK